MFKALPFFVMIYDKKNQKVKQTNNHLLQTLFPDKFNPQELEKLVNQKQKIKVFSRECGLPVSDSAQNVRTASIKELICDIKQNETTKLSIKLTTWKRHILFIGYHLSPNECLALFIDTS